MTKTKDTTFDQLDGFVGDMFDEISRWCSIIYRCQRVLHTISPSKAKFRAKKKLLQGQKQGGRILPAIPKKRNKFQYTSGFL